MAEEIIKELIVRQEKTDSLEIRETAKHELLYTIKVYGDVENPDEFIKKINIFKEKVEKDILMRRS